MKNFFSDWQGRATLWRQWVVLAVVCGAPLWSHAAPPTAISVDTLLTLSRAQDQIEAMYVNVGHSMRQAMAQATQGKPLSAEQQRFVAAVPESFVSVIKEEFSWASLQPVYRAIYQESFTQEEVDGLIAFYRTPGGQSFVTKMPMVIQKSSSALQPRLQTLAEKMQAAVEKALAAVGTK